MKKFVILQNLLVKYADSDQTSKLPLLDSDYKIQTDVRLIVKVGLPAVEMSFYGSLNKEEFEKTLDI